MPRILLLSTLILTAGENDSMPPAGGPSAEDRAMLAEWIQCGSPE